MSFPEADPALLNEDLLQGNSQTPPARANLIGDGGCAGPLGLLRERPGE
jgi:hypothetical protein